jgi:hypothetical protein
MNAQMNRQNEDYLNSFQCVCMASLELTHARPEVTPLVLVQLVMFKALQTVLLTNVADESGSLGQVLVIGLLGSCKLSFVFLFSSQLHLNVLDAFLLILAIYDLSVTVGFLASNMSLKVVSTILKLGIRT